MDGYIKLSRNLLKWGWYDDPATSRVWIHLLLTVNWSPGVWHGFSINEGERITSIAKIARELGVSERNVRTAISHLKATGEIATERQSNFTKITVIKWALYQGKPDESDELMTSEETSRRHYADEEVTNSRQTGDDNIRRIKKNKNKKNKKNNYSSAADERRQSAAVGLLKENFKKESSEITDAELQEKERLLQELNS